MGVQGVHGVQGSVIASLLRVWVSETRGQVLLTGWAVTFAGITGRAFWLRRKQKKALANTAVAAAAKKTPIEAAPESERPCRRDEKEKRANTEKKEAGPILSVLRLAMPSYRGRAGAWLVVFSLGLGVKVLVAGRVSPLAPSPPRAPCPLPGLATQHPPGIQPPRAGVLRDR